MTYCAGRCRCRCGVGGRDRRRGTDCMGPLPWIEWSSSRKIPRHLTCIDIYRPSDRGRLHHRWACLLDPNEGVQLRLMHVGLVRRAGSASKPHNCAPPTCPQDPIVTGVWRRAATGGWIRPARSSRAERSGERRWRRGRKVDGSALMRIRPPAGAAMLSPVHPIHTPRISYCRTRSFNEA